MNRGNNEQSRSNRLSDFLHGVRPSVGGSWASAKEETFLESEDLAKFRASMKIGYLEFHDGIGYDLDALGRLGGEERRLAEDMLLARQSADWRDVEALDMLGSPRALAEIRRSLQSTNLEVRMRAAERLTSRGLLSDAMIESLVLESLDSATILNGMVSVLRFAEAHPTPHVCRKLLWCAVNGNDDIRVHAAALAHFLHGKSASAFDFSFRPLYLRFRSEHASERQAALVELCHSMGIEPPAPNWGRTDLTKRTPL